MRVPIEQFQNVESGPCVIIGNGPTMNDWKGAEWDCPIIGINRSVDFWSEQDYFVTVAWDRLGDIVEGKITAKKAVFTCLHKASASLDELPQTITYADMSISDIYATTAVKGLSMFSTDLTRPILRTFGGVYAVQVAWYLGYNPLYLIAFDGGTEKFYGWHPRLKELGPNGMLINGGYHNLVFWHVKDFMDKNKDKGYMIYNCNSNSAIRWFDHAQPPLKKPSPIIL